MNFSLFRVTRKGLKLRITSHRWVSDTENVLNVMMRLSLYTYHVKFVPNHFLQWLPHLSITDSVLLMKHCSNRNFPHMAPELLIELVTSNELHCPTVFWPEYNDGLYIGQPLVYAGASRTMMVFLGNTQEFFSGCVMSVLFLFSNLNLYQ